MPLIGLMGSGGMRWTRRVWWAQVNRRRGFAEVATGLWVFLTGVYTFAEVVRLFIAGMVCVCGWLRPMTEFGDDCVYT